MAGRDGTGPMGFGPMTGRGAGNCVGSFQAGYGNFNFGRRFGGRGAGNFARGGGRGWRNRYYLTERPGWARADFDYSGSPEGRYSYTPEITVKEETDMLKREADFLKTQLENIQNQISALEKAQSKTE